MKVNPKLHERSSHTLTENYDKGKATNGKEGYNKAQQEQALKILDKRGTVLFAQSPYIVNFTPDKPTKP
jgi:hypothetical protein